GAEREPNPFEEVPFPERHLGHDLRVRIDMWALLLWSLCRLVQSEAAARTRLLLRLLLPVAPVHSHPFVHLRSVLLGRAVLQRDLRLARDPLGAHARRINTHVTNSTGATHPLRDPHRRVHHHCDQPGVAGPDLLYSQSTDARPRALGSPSPQPHRPVPRRAVHPQPRLDRDPLVPSDPVATVDERRERS
ncbi:hypothetical protein Gpo141_00015170, partial [Globisporangium polare]